MCVLEKSYFSFLFYVYHRFEVLFSHSTYCSCFMLIYSLLALVDVFLPFHRHLLNILILIIN